MASIQKCYWAWGAITSRHLENQSVLFQINNKSLVWQFWPTLPKTINNEEKEGRQLLENYVHCIFEVRINCFLYSEMKNSWARKDYENSEMGTD